MTDSVFSRRGRRKSKLAQLDFVGAAAAAGAAAFVAVAVAVAVVVVLLFRSAAIGVCVLFSLLALPLTLLL